MARFSIPFMLQGAAQVASAQEQGAFEGNQQLLANQAQQFSQVMAAANAEQQRQMEMQRATLGAGLTPGSSALALGGMWNPQTNPDPYVALAQTGVGRRNPAIANLFRQQPAAPSPAPGAPVGQPTAGVTGATIGAGVAPGVGAPTGGAIPSAPRGAPAPAGSGPPVGPGGGPTFHTPAGTMELRGIPKGAAEATLRMLRDLQKEGDNTDWNQNPAAREPFYNALKTAPTAINSESDMRQVQEALATARYYKPSGPAAENAARLLQKNDEDAHRKDVSDYLIKGAIPPRSLTIWLPDALAQEDALKARGGKTAGPGVLQGYRAEIGDIQKHRANAEALQATDTDQANREWALADQGAQELAARYQAKLPQAQEQKGIANVLRAAGQLGPNVKPDTVRSLYRAYGLGSIADTLPDEAMNTGGALASRQLQQAMDNLPRWKDLDPATQQVTLDNLKYLANVAGRQITIPKQILDVMTPYQRAEIGFMKDKVLISSFNADTESQRAETAAGELQLGRDRFNWTKNQVAKNTNAKGQITADRLMQPYIEAARDTGKAYEKYFTKGQDLSGERGTFDPTRSYPSGTAQFNAAKAWKAAQDAGTALHQFVDMSAARAKIKIPPLPSTAPAGGAGAPTTGQPAPGAAQGQPQSGAWTMKSPENQQYHGVDKAAFRNGLIAAKKTPAEVNAIMNRIWGGQ